MAPERDRIRLRCLATAFLQDADLARDHALLDGDERTKAGRFRLAEDRRDYVAAHGLLRRMLSAAAPDTAPAAWRFDRRPLGKPVVRSVAPASPTLPFSLSHARGLVACVVGGRGELGLDVECDASFDVAPLIAEMCSRDEKLQLASLHPSERGAAFLDHWTLKEAHAKARGTGIADPSATVTSFDLRRPGTIAGRFGNDGTPGCGFALFRPTVNSRMALAVEGRDGSPTMLDAAIVDPDGALTVLHPDRIGHIGRR